MRNYDTQNAKQQNKYKLNSICLIHIPQKFDLYFAWRI